MSDQSESDRLLELLNAALAHADACGSTLIGAMLAECIDCAERNRMVLVDPEGGR